MKHSTIRERIVEPLTARRHFVLLDSGRGVLLRLLPTSTLAHGRTVYGVPAAAVPGGGEMAALFFHPLPKHGAGKRP